MNIILVTNFVISVFFFHLVISVLDCKTVDFFSKSVKKAVKCDCSRILEYAII